MNTNKQISRVEYLKNTAIKEYVENKNSTVLELCDKHKCSTTTLRKIMIEMNIPRRNRYHDIILNNYFATIDSEESAYWLGFLYADGSVTYSPNDKRRTYKLDVSLCEKDKNHLIKLKEFLGAASEVKERKHGNAFRLIVSSKKLCENLHKLGVVKRKTYVNNIKDVFKNVPKKYFKDFLRGFTDGDGSIFEKGIVSYTSYYEETMTDLMSEVPFELEYKTYIRDDRAPRICITKQKYFFKLLKYLYKDSNIHLDRKYERYTAVMSRNIHNY